MSTPTEWLKVGELVTLGRFGHTCEVVEVTPTSESDLFSHRAAQENPMIYRFRNRGSGREFCLSHGALTEAELQSRHETPVQAATATRINSPTRREQCPVTE